MDDVDENAAVIVIRSVCPFSFRTHSGLFQSCPEKIISYMWGPYVHVWDHMIPVPYKVRGTIR